MTPLFLKKFFFVSLLIFLINFSFLPEIGLAEITPEETIKIQDKIELKEKDAKDILHSLIQKIANEWILTTSSPDLVLEEQAILVILSPSIKTEVGNYLFWELPKEIGKDLITATIKIARLILAEDPAVIIEEIEKFTVEKAKEYAMNWLLQNEIRFNNGNFETSYLDYNKNWQKITLPYIIVYRPLGPNSGEVGIGVYSSDPIRTPMPIKAYPWEGGIEKLPPFIFRISGKVQKTDSGYKWTEGPQFRVEFPAEVPKFEFSEPGFFEKIENDLNRIRIAIERASEEITKIGENVKNFAENLWEKFKQMVSKFNPFGAAVGFFSQFSGKEKTALESSLKETESELEKLRKEISLLEDKLETEEEARSELRQQYESEISNLTVQLDNLNEMVESFNQQLTEQATAKSKEESTKEEGVGEEVEEEAEQEVGQGINFCQITRAGSPKRNKVIFNEIAWMGTEVSSSDEWMELKNISGAEVNLAGWQILDKDGRIKIIFSSGERFSANGFYLLERTDDDSVPNIPADKIYTGALNDTNETLYLFNKNCELEDEVLANPDWPAGDKSSKRTMERKFDLSWQTSSNSGGTPKRENSSGYVVAPIIPTGGGGVPSPEPSPSAPLKILITEIQTTAGPGKTTHDFIELYNPNNQPVNLKGYRLVKRTKSGTSDSSIKSWTTDVFIPVDGYYLWINSNYSELASIADVSTSATIAADNGIAIRFGPENTGTIIDSVAWGAAENMFVEKQVFPTNPGKDQSLGRKWIEGQGYQDTDDNSVDFEIQTPSPKIKNESSEERTPPFGIFVSDAETVWNLGLVTASLDVRDSNDAPPQDLDVAFVSHAETVWSLYFPVLLVDIIDSTDAPSQILPEVYVSEGESIWRSSLEKQF